jgi:hypothetical protein
VYYTRQKVNLWMYYFSILYTTKLGSIVKILELGIGINLTL